MSEKSSPIFETGKSIPWFCESCKVNGIDTILGFIDQQGKVLRIKVGDVYIWIEGGSVTRTCKKCGQLNQILQVEK